MYQGKFDAKHKKTNVDISELVSQRNAAPAAKQAPQKQAPQKQAPQKQAPQKQAPQKQAAKAAPAPETAARQPARKPAPQQQPARKAAPQSAPVPQKKKGPRLGGVIFYTFYFMFILLFFLGTYFGLQWLQGWLTDFEAAQPTVKCQQVFDQLFADPDWGALYDTAGVEDTAYEGKAQYVAYMEQKVGSTELTYMETSAGLSGDKKYIVKLGNEKVASFTLSGETAQITDIPEWDLGTVELFFTREESFLIEKMDGHTAYVNDVALTDDFTIQIATTMAEQYLPIGTTGARMCTQQITDLMAVPTVTVFDEKGNQMEVTYDETTRTFTERTEANTITEDEKTVVLEAAETYCKWMIKEVTNRATIAKYFDASSDTYSEIVRTTELWMQSHNGYKFSNEELTNYARYNDSLFSVRVTMTVDVTRTDGTVKQYPFAKTMFFSKQDTGKWLCFEMTNVDVSTPVGQVKITFMDDDQALDSKFVATDATELTTPLVSVPEGQVFSGWVRKDVGEDGKTTLTVVFQPDENGHVSIPSGITLEPMTLYALYEDASSAAVETPDITEGA